MGGIVWLASYPKSGNTWMRAFLHNLLRNPARPMEINELDKFCLGDSQVYWFEHVSGRKISELSRQDIARLRPKVHAAFTEAHPDSVFAKTHNMLAESEGAPLINLDCTVGAIFSAVWGSRSGLAFATSAGWPPVSGAAATAGAGGSTGAG